jgi:hypothetical protein
VITLTNPADGHPRRGLRDVITKIRIATPADTIVCRIGFRYPAGCWQAADPHCRYRLDSGDVVSLEVGW